PQPIAFASGELSPLFAALAPQADAWLASVHLHASWQPLAEAIAVAATGVLVLAVSGGGALWISLLLAASFGFYGLLRKIASIDALGGL
ncbi:MAG: hypothetical protein ACLGHY_06850, partial [Gammaproteobacteria bacterium]